MLLWSCLEASAPREAVEIEADAEPECTKPEDCPIGLQCISGSCRTRPPCDSDDDCPTEWECIQGGCYVDAENAPRDGSGGGGTDSRDSSFPSFDSELGLPDAPDPEDASDPSTEENCKDGKDNDDDGDVDCADSDCGGEVCSDDGKICTLAADSQCECPDTEESETSCGDGIDNDCDGDVDCEDIDCSKRGCDPDQPKKRCEYVTESCEFPTGEANCSGETFCCGDGEDNDGDGDTDCEDSDCHGERCDSEKWCRQSSENSPYECQ